MFPESLRDIHENLERFLLFQKPHHVFITVQARDRVLTQMLDNGFVNEADVQDAKRVPLKLMRTEIAGNEAPYFVDMVKDHLLEDYSEADLLSQNYRVYTTLDPQLQRAAAAAGRSNGFRPAPKPFSAIRMAAIKS